MHLSIQFRHKATSTMSGEITTVSDCAEATHCLQQNDMFRVFHGLKFYLKILYLQSWCRCWPVALIIRLHLGFLLQVFSPVRFVSSYNVSCLCPCEERSPSVYPTNNSGILARNLGGEKDIRKRNSKKHNINITEPIWTGIYGIFSQIWSAEEYHTEGSWNLFSWSTSSTGRNCIKTNNIQPPNREAGQLHLHPAQTPASVCYEPNLHQQLSSYWNLHLLETSIEKGRYFLFSIAKAVKNNLHHSSSVQQFILVLKKYATAVKSNQDAKTSKN